MPNPDHPESPIHRAAPAGIPPSPRVGTPRAASPRPASPGTRSRILGRAAPLPSLVDGVMPPPLVISEECFCLNSMRGSPDLSVIQCGHLFHTTCILGWVNSTYGGTDTKSCPLCRFEPLSMVYPLSAYDDIIQIDVMCALEAEIGSPVQVRGANVPVVPSPRMPVAQTMPAAVPRAGIVRNGPGWHPNTANCMSCNRHFNLFIRRHHCRQCGQVICSNCVQKNRLGHIVCTPCFAENIRQSIMEGFRRTGLV